MIIKVTTGNGRVNLPLELPATDAEVRKVESVLETECGCGHFQVVSVECPVSSLGKYLVDKYVSNPDVRKKLNTLAEKVKVMDKETILVRFKDGTEIQQQIERTKGERAS